MTGWDETMRDLLSDHMREILTAIEDKLIEGVTYGCGVRVSTKFTRDGPVTTVVLDRDVPLGQVWHERPDL